jgi:hypothetical protein
MSGAPIIIGICQLAGHGETEDHDQRVHRGHLVEEVRVHQLQARLPQLGTDHQRHQAADDGHDEGEDQVQGADVLVVGGEQPAGKAGGMICVMCGCHV